MTKTRRNIEQGPSLSATVASQQLAELPVGSIESRAAARRLLDAREASRGKGTLIRIRFIGRDGKAIEEGKVCTCKEPPAGEVAVCRCFI